MSVRQNMLRFASRNVSQSSLAGALGVSQSTVSRWVRGLRDVPSSFMKDIRKVFRREAYTTLKSVGANVNIAKKYASYGYNSVMLKISEISLMSEDFTTGAFADWLNKSGRQLTDAEISQYWNKIHDDVVEAMRSSRLPVDIWEYYFNRANVALQ